MFKINIHNLKEGEQKYEFTAKYDDLNLGDVEFSIPGEIKIDIILYKIVNQISVKAFLKGKFEFDCDRCTEKYIQDFDTDFEIIYKYDFREKQTGISETDDDIKIIPHNTIFIDIKEDIRDFIMLSVPLRKVPEENEGKCLFCNKKISEILSIPVKEEVNPVWEKLIRSKLKD